MTRNDQSAALAASLTRKRSGARDSRTRIKGRRERHWIEWMAGLGMIASLGCVGTGSGGSYTRAEQTAKETLQGKSPPQQYSPEQAEYVEERQQSLKDRAASPISKVIISREDIVQFRDRRASDVLRRMPGIVLGGAPGKNRSLRLRGLGPEYTQILINGERIAGSGEKRSFQLDRIPADMIERIEIIKNPTAEYSNDAVAGIVNIILRQAPPPLNLDELLGIGEPDDTKPGSERFMGDRGGAFNKGRR